MNPMLLLDCYKFDHRRQYPNGTNLVYSNFTPRTSRNPNIKSMMFFGLQYACQEYLINRFNDGFFNRPKHDVVSEYKAITDSMLGKDSIDVQHIADLHDLQCLPIKIKAVPEGVSVPMGCPAMTIVNTHPKFFWLTNYLETLLSALLWKPCTSATTANQFYNVFKSFASETADNVDFVEWQGHDFSMRGMSGVEDAMVSGAAHLIHFYGTDTVPAIPFIQKYYPTSSFIGGSVAATEHSVMASGRQENEYETYKRLINEVYPKGIVSIVSDTYDFWQVITEFLPKLKSDILKRHQNDDSGMGKVVIRPDSGVPHKIMNGDPNATTECEKKGLARCLFDIFGGKVNSKGYRQLHPCIGAIYGDGINFQEQVNILQGLKDNGFSTTNTVLGLGSFTYQYVTRDTFGTVCKATYCEVNGEPREIFKSPKTGAWKKSHKGLLRVNRDFTYDEQVSWAEEKEGLLSEIFVNSQMVKTYSFDEVRLNAKMSHV